MKRACLFWVAATAAVGALHAQGSNRARAWFPDGIGLEIYTEAIGPAAVNAAGEIGIGPGTVTKALVNRVVIDGGNNILFAYNLEASKGAEPGTVAVRVEPLNAATEAELLGRQTKQPRLPRFSGAHLPTVAAVRDFPSVKIGEVVTLDIRYNTSTGEKIYDLLRPITDSPPTPPPFPVVRASRSRPTLSLKDTVIKVNGRAIPAPASWIMGAVLRLDIPGRGEYIVATYDPKKMAPGYPFQAVATADGKALRWAMDGDKVEIASSTNVLTQPAQALWVYHDPRSQSKALRLQTADTVEGLLPKK